MYMHVSFSSREVDGLPWEFKDSTSRVYRTQLLVLLYVYEVKASVVELFK